MDITSQVRRLCADFEHRQIKCFEFLEQRAQLAARSVGCSRRHLVLPEPTPQLKLHCVAMFDARNACVSRVPDETGPAVEKYLVALEHAGHVMATDAATLRDRRIFRWRARGNLSAEPAGCAFSVNGRLYGAFTCTQVGSQMEWTRRHLATLRYTGFRRSLALADAERTAPDRQPSTLSDESR